MTPFEQYRAAVLDEIHAQERSYMHPKDKPLKKDLTDKLRVLLEANGELAEGARLSFHPLPAFFNSI